MKRQRSQGMRDGRAQHDGASKTQRQQLHVAHTTLHNELRRRVPWMFLALVAGVSMVFVSRHFELALSRHVELVLFIPMIVYIRR